VAHGNRRRLHWGLRREVGDGDARRTTPRTQSPLPGDVRLSVAPPSAGFKVLIS
jgi:hypothetical protein